MEDLLPPQIKDSCKLALPEGLNDLMSDISREVLRYQPRNLYQFIADYLSALLVTRENLTIAANICMNVNDCGCQPELEHELEDIGLNEEDVQTAKEIILKYFEKGTVNEGSLITQLTKKTSIQAAMLPAIQEAIRVAYIHHQEYHTTVFESSSDSEEDEMICAAKHSLSLYKKTAPSVETCHTMSEKIQAAYRAYGVRRRCVSKYHTPKSEDTKSHDKSVTLIDPKLGLKSSSYDIDYPKLEYSQDMLSDSTWPDAEIAASSSMHQKRVTTMSSTCLAGSFMLLPTDKPYSAHDPEGLSDLEEIPEKEFAYLDYTADTPHVSIVTEDKLFKGESHKKISFSESAPEAAKKMGLEVDDDSESRDDDLDRPDQSNQSSMQGSEDLFYQADVGSEDNYDGDVEVEINDYNVTQDK